MIEQFRTVWNDNCGRACGMGDGQPSIAPRSAGRVARWALERAAAILEVSGRTRLRVAENLEATPTPHERSLAIIAEALANGDRAAARAHAQWLVRPEAIEHFLRALEPIASGPARLVEAA